MKQREVGFYYTRPQQFREWPWGKGRKVACSAAVFHILLPPLNSALQSFHCYCLSCPCLLIFSFLRHPTDPHFLSSAITSFLCLLSHCLSFLCLLTRCHPFPFHASLAVLVVCLPPSHCPSPHSPLCPSPHPKAIRKQGEERTPQLEINVTYQEKGGKKQELNTTCLRHVEET